MECENGGIDDIEDMIGPIERNDNLKSNTVIRKVIKKKQGLKDDFIPEEKSAVPGSQTLWLKTYGCSHNVSDSEYMQGLLANYGYSFTETKEDADLWVLNSCTVKDPSQAAFMHLVKEAQKKNIGLVVAGCVPQADRKLRDQGLAGISMVGVQQIDKIVDVVEQTLQGNKVRHLGQRELPLLDLPKIRRNPLIEIVPLSTGCLGACTYCKTRYARGALGSYAPEAILGRVQKVVEEGVTEVWLSSEDTGAYGRDIGTSLAELLNRIVEILPEDVMLRVGMTNPPFILSQLDDVARILNHPNVFSFLHVPVQSGSNDVLEKMFREYTVEEFREVADHLIKHVPGMTVATDIICGFPGETEEDFDKTLKLIEDYQLGIVNISQFYPRPGTPAAKMKRIPTQIVKDRSRKLTKMFTLFEPYAGMEGTEHKIWINTEVTDDGKYNVGHTKNYVKVLVTRDDKKLVGSTAFVRVVSSHRFHVVAEILSSQKVPSFVNSSVEEEISFSASKAAVVQKHKLQNKTSRSSSSKPNETGSKTTEENCACGAPPSQPSCSNNSVLKHDDKKEGESLQLPLSSGEQKAQQPENCPGKGWQTLCTCLAAGALLAVGVTIFSTLRKNKHN